APGTGTRLEAPPQRTGSRRPGTCHVFMLAAGLLLPLWYAAGTRPAERKPHEDAAEKIRRIGLREEGAYGFLERLTAIGPRLTGSAEAESAVALMKRIMLELGFDDVHLEPVTVNRWIRGEKEEAKVIGAGGGKDIALTVSALGGSVGTPESGLTAPVLEVRSFEDLAVLGPKAKGSIIFFNTPMDRASPDPFAAYGSAAAHRVNGAVEASRLGARAVLIRSLTFRRDDFPHTGLMRYDPSAPKIPAAALSTEDAETLSRLLSRATTSVTVRLNLSCRTLAPVSSANVVGQLTGTGLPQEIVLVGGHLDSWDLGTGAHDDGAGCVQAVEALRLIRAAGLAPRRTIRAVMFMDEEFGGTGGRFYAESKRRRAEKHIAAFESDRGGFTPLGMGIGGGGEIFGKLSSWDYLFRPLGIRMTPGGGGVDIAPLAARGTVLLSLVPDSQRYFDVHHSAHDVLAAVHPRELELGAVALAIFSYVIAQEGI
ncbi:MAG: M20/M25/M40 family metallo-hydrolase, partial [Acidobacteriota bacterium]|nr:M20/M25/M40 family metallo-hydrolase [Acidobacteriota bacterium]